MPRSVLLGDLVAGDVVLRLLAVVLPASASVLAVDARLVEGRTGRGGRPPRRGSTVGLDRLARLAGRTGAARVSGVRRRGRNQGEPGGDDGDRQPTHDDPSFVGQQSPGEHGPSRRY